MPWDWSADYQKQTCFVLAKKHQVIAFMYLDAVFFLKKFFQKEKKYPQLPNINFYQPSYFLPFRRLALINKINQIINLKIIAWKYNQAQNLLHSWLKNIFSFEQKRKNGKEKNLILWIFDPSFYFYPKTLKATSIYDCVDYQWRINEAEKKQVQAMEKKLIDNVDYFLVNSKALQKIHQKQRVADLLVPQGFRSDDFQKAKAAKSLPKNKPLIGFVGALGYRLDYPLLFSLIENNPQWNFVLWGPKQIEKNLKADETAKNLKKLLQYENVISGENKNRKKIPSIIKQFDVCMIPYNPNYDFNRYCYPMKLFEYFYLGKPVISTEIEELKYFPKYVKISNQAAEWEKHICQLLKKPWQKKYQQEQKQLAIENSWEKKVEMILKLIARR